MEHGVVHSQRWRLRCERRLMVRVCVYRESETVRCPLSLLSVFTHIQIYSSWSRMFVSPMWTRYWNKTGKEVERTVRPLAHHHYVLLTQFLSGTYMCLCILCVHNDYSIRSVVNVDACVYSGQMLTHTGRQSSNYNTLTTLLWMLCVCWCYSRPAWLYKFGEGRVVNGFVGSNLTHTTRA